MLGGALVLILAVGTLARPDVSHLLKKEKSLSSYEVPVNSVDGQYITSRYAFQHDKDVPFIKYFPSFVNSQRYRNPTYAYYVSQSGQKQIPIKIISGSYPEVYGGQGYGTVYYLSQGQGQGQGVGNVQYLSQGFPGVGNVQYVSQGLGGGNTNVHYVSQGGHGGGGGNVHYISQGGLGGGAGNVHYISQGGLGGGLGNVHYVSQGGHGGINFVAQGAGSGDINTGRVVKNPERVYFFSAPEDIVKHKSRLRINVLPTHTKNSNVIVVKAPSVETIIPEVVLPSSPVVEEKTKVVVLVKEHDHYVPLTVHAPAPITQGKAEVVVAKYHDKNDVARVVTGGPIVGSTLTGQDKATFINTGGVNLLSRFDKGFSNSVNVDNSGSVLALVNEVPQLRTYTADNVGNVDVVQNVEGVEIKSASDDQSSNVGNTGQTYELKTVEISGTSPGYNAQNQEGFEIKSVGGQLVSTADQQNLGARFISDNSGYTLKTSELVQNEGPSVDYGSISGLQKVLGDGIEIVSVTRGTLQGSAVGSDAQDSILSSLGVSQDDLKEGVSGNTDGAQIGSSFFQTSSSSSSGTGSSGTTGESARQIQIGNDVADVLSGSSLKA